MPINLQFQGSPFLQGLGAWMGARAEAQRENARQEQQYRMHRENLVAGFARQGIGIAGNMVLQNQRGIQSLALAHQHAQDQLALRRQAATEALNRLDYTDQIEYRNLLRGYGYTPETLANEAATRGISPETFLHTLDAQRRQQTEEADLAARGLERRYTDGQNLRLQAIGEEEAMLRGRLNDPEVSEGERRIITRRMDRLYRERSGIVGVPQLRKPKFTVQDMIDNGFVKQNPDGSYLSVQMPNGPQIRLNHGPKIEQTPSLVPVKLLGDYVKQATASFRAQYGRDPNIDEMAEIAASVSAKTGKMFTWETGNGDLMGYDQSGFPKVLIKADKRPNETKDWDEIRKIADQIEREDTPSGESISRPEAMRRAEEKWDIDQAIMAGARIDWGNPPQFTSAVTGSENAPAPAEGEIRWITVKATGERFRARRRPDGKWERID